MPDAFFEDAVVTVKETVRKKTLFGTKPYNGPAKICFFKGTEAQPFHTTTVQVANGALDKQLSHRLPKVAATEEYYDLRVTLEYKKVNKLLFRATVWPKEVKILMQDQGNQPMKFLPFLVRQRGAADQKLVTDGAGKCAITLLERGPYSIVQDGKYLILKDEQVTAGQYRDHKITALNAIKAKFIAPDITKPEYKNDPDKAPAKMQFVNLPSKEKDHDPECGCEAKGHLVVFRVAADPPDSGQPGDRVYFEINFGKESKRNDPPPKLMPDWPVNDLKTEGKKTTGYVILAPMAEGDHGFFEVDLGIAGGDTCEIKIGGTPEAADASMKLVTWRKLYGQVTSAATQTVPSLQTVVDSLKKVYVDFEESQADAVTVDASTAPVGTVVDGNAVIQKGLPASSVVIGDHNVDFFKALLKPRFASEKLPVAHIIYCDKQLDAQGAEMAGDINVLGKKTGQNQGMVNFPGAGNVPGIAIAGNIAARTGLVFSKDLRDGTDAVKTLTWTAVGGGGNGTIMPADYLIDYPNHGNNLYIRLPDAAKTLSDAGTTIKISLRVAYANGWFTGWCTKDDRHSVIQIGRPDDQICQTILHEVGHAMHQGAVDQGTYPGLKPPHERFYTNDRGHYGPHCADGIDDAYYNNKTNPMNVQYCSDRCTCVMYGGAVPARTSQILDFCARCSPFAKAAPLEKMSY